MNKKKKYLDVPGMPHFNFQDELNRRLGKTPKQKAPELRATPSLANPAPPPDISGHLRPQGPFARKDAPTQGVAASSDDIKGFARGALVNAPIGAAQFAMSAVTSRGDTA